MNWLKKILKRTKNTGEVSKETKRKLHRFYGGRIRKKRLYT